VDFDASPFDASLVVIAAIFAVTYWILRHFLFVPIADLLERRGEAVSSAKQLYEQARAQTQAELESARARLIGRRAEAVARRDHLRREALLQRQEVLRQARAACEQEIATALIELDRKVASERSLLESRAESLAAEMTSKLLRRAS
jgi:F0F1-type ATP synthase membrane subunit b/b'